MEKKFAFILMGSGFTPQSDQACFETKGQVTRIFTVRDFEEARALIIQLKQDGFGAVELCGAFGPEKARELIELTENQMAVGFVTHFPEQDQIVEAFFAG